MASTPDLHPAQNRGLRELYAALRQLVAHWSQLSRRLGAGLAPMTLDQGVAAARSLLVELADITAEYGLYGRPAAQGVGARLAGTRNLLGDKALERNQALRFAVLDVQHVVTLLSYQARIARGRGDARLADFLDSWRDRMIAVERSARAVAVEEGDDPDLAIHPMDTGPVGKLAHGAQNVVGTFGEWFDRRSAR
jgi:hypothetical protein